MGVTIDKEALLAGLEKYGEADKFQDLLAGIKEAGWLKRIAKCLALVPLAIGLVEKVYFDLSELRAGGGKEKKQAVVQWLDDVIDLPFWMETFDGTVIGWAVDGIVAWLNLTKGKLWLDLASDFLGVDEFVNT